MADLKEALQENDPALLAEMQCCFEAARRFLASREETDPLLGSRVIEFARDGHSCEEWLAAAGEAGRRSGECDRHNVDLALSAEAALRQAITLFAGRRPDLSGYESKRRVVAAFNALPPGEPAFRLSPESHLRGSGTWQTLAREFPLPSREEEAARAFGHFSDLRHGYWDDPAYRRLVELPAAELPGAAVPFLFSLRPVSTQELSHGGSPGVPAEELLWRYGKRLLPWLIDLTGSPGTYRHPENYRAFPGGIVAGISGDTASFRLFAAALEEGWREAAADLPPGTGPVKLLEAFADSPYGPPYQPFWRSSSPAASRLDDEKRKREGGAG